MNAVVFWLTKKTKNKEQLNLNQKHWRGHKHPLCSDHQSVFHQLFTLAAAYTYSTLWGRWKIHDANYNCVARSFASGSRDSHRYGVKRPHRTSLPGFTSSFFKSVPNAQQPVTDAWAQDTLIVHQQTTHNIFTIFPATRLEYYQTDLDVSFLSSVRLSQRKQKKKETVASPLTMPSIDCYAMWPQDMFCWSVSQPWHGVSSLDAFYSEAFYLYQSNNIIWVQGEVSEWIDKPN